MPLLTLAQSVSIRPFELSSSSPHRNGPAMRSAPGSTADPGGRIDDVNRQAPAGITYVARTMVLIPRSHRDHCFPYGMALQERPALPPASLGREASGTDNHRSAPTVLNADDARLSLCQH
jgi:hypothetical protein